MKWTIRIEVTPDGSARRSREVGLLTREELRDENIGLTLEEGRRLLQSLEMAIISNQAAYFEERRRRCTNCERPQRVKDVRTKCVQTVFGRYRFRGRRFQTCKCFRFFRMPKTLFPLGELIPRRTTPEVRYLLVELGARMPYREASRTFKMCSFGGMRASHTAIRRYTLALGYFLHWQQFHSFLPDGAKRPEAADSMVVGIDDTYIRHHKPRASRQIQVTAGRVERNGELAGGLLKPTAWSRSGSRTTSGRSRSRCGRGSLKPQRGSASGRWRTRGITCFRRSGCSRVTARRCVPGKRASPRSKRTWRITGGSSRGSLSGQ